MDVLEVIKTRRTVCLFKQRSLASEQIMTILDAGRWAPSGKNRQSWEFIIRRNEKTRQKICELFLRYFYKFYESRPENDPWRIRVKNKLDLVKKFYRNAQVFVAVLGNTAAETYIQDTSAAIENITLAAWTLGIGTAWLGMLPEKEIHNLLDIPKEFKLMACVPFGYPEEIPDRPSRKKFEEIVHYERYGQKNPPDIS